MERYPRYDDIIDWHAGASDPPARAPGDPLGVFDYDVISTDPLGVSEPVFLGHEREYVNDCLDRRWLTQGLYVGRLERAFEEYLGRRFAIACSSGTSALHLAMLGLGVTEGDVVLVPALTYIATANAVSYCGASPVFVDVDRDTWCMDPDDVERKVKRLELAGEHNVRGAIPVHLFDSVVDLEAISRALPHGAFVVEDAAQAIGARYGSFAAGSFGDVATFSMYGSKTITAGEGGMVVTDNEITAEMMRLMRGQGADRSGRYEHDAIGYNSRMTDIGGAIGLPQFETLEYHLERRRLVIDYYRERLAAIPGLKLQRQGRPSEEDTSGAWSMAVVLPKGTNRDEVSRLLLEEHRIETRPCFVPLHCTRAYEEHGPVSACPVSVQLANRGINMPTHAGLTEAHVEMVVDALEAVLA